MDAFLARRRHLDEAGAARMDYAAVTSEERAALDGYVASLTVVDPARLTRDQALAYWINLYNASVVAVVLDAYPVGSITGIRDGWLSFGPWKRTVATVAGTKLSLGEIEHGIVRPIFREPRVHYALNCAAVGCPNLAPRAWRAEGLDAALAEAERAYVNNPRGVSIGSDEGLTLSKIYLWFRDDFGVDEAAVLRRLEGAAAPHLATKLAGRENVDRHAYDWSLNDAQPAPAAAGE